MNIVPTDVGRRIGDLHSNVDVPELESLIEDVVESDNVREREVREIGARWYSMLVRPYRAADDTVTGAVIVFQDIDQRKHHAEQLDEARRYANAIVESVREPLLVLDPELRVQRANRAFYEMFQTTASDTEACSLFELGDGQWNIPPLRVLRDELVPNEILFGGIEFEHAFPSIGRRVVLLSGRQIVFDDGRPPLMLLAIEDITARRDFERRGRFLTEAAAVFAASVGYDATIDAIGAVAVPAFAELCTVDLSEPDGTMLRTRVITRERDSAGLVEPRVRKAVIVPEPIVSTVHETGESILVERGPAVVPGLRGMGWRGSPAPARIRSGIADRRPAAGGHAFARCGHLGLDAIRRGAPLRTETILRSPRSSRAAPPSRSSGPRTIATWRRRGGRPRWRIA